jgi:hypothetical protein
MRKALCHLWVKLFKGLDAYDWFPSRVLDIDDA